MACVVPCASPRKSSLRRYQIPVGTIRDWEQRRSEPDAAARAYLRAIIGDPDGVARALIAAPGSRAAAE
jgi:hypothetical protein